MTFIVHAVWFVIVGFGYLLADPPLVSASASSMSGVETEAKTGQRTVMAWVYSSAAASAADQLLNKSWAGVFDGVQAGCGWSFSEDGRQITVNETLWKACAPLHAACRKKGIKFNALLGAPPSIDMDAAESVVRSAVALAKQYDVDGFSIDDETDCAPRSTLDRFAAWIDYVNAFASGLHATGDLTLSAAVQAMFGIQDVAYKPACKPVKNPSCSQACNRQPYMYNPLPEVSDLMSNSSIDRWLEMDTYYFGTDRFLGALDWYTDNVALDKLGVAVMNRNDISAEGYLARFHAIDGAGVNWLNVFHLPASDTWLPFLQRWKTRCRGCGVNTPLGCYNMELVCKGGVE